MEPILVVGVPNGASWTLLEAILVVTEPNGEHNGAYIGSEDASGSIMEPNKPFFFEPILVVSVLQGA